MGPNEPCQAGEYPFYCSSCFLSKDKKVPLQLRLVEKTVWEGHYTRAAKDERDDLSGEVYPTFEVETGGGEVEWQPEFWCPACKTKEYVLNSTLVYDDDHDRLFVPVLDPDDVLGWVKPPALGPEPLPKIRHLRDEALLLSGA